VLVASTASGPAAQSAAKETLKPANAAPRDSNERRETFYRMHRELAAAQQEHPDIKQWEARLRDTLRTDAEDAPLFDRELFYAIQPRDRLAALVDRYRADLA
jgi:hypothetical protein